MTKYILFSYTQKSGPRTSAMENASDRITFLTISHVKAYFEKPSVKRNGAGYLVMGAL